MDNYTEHVLNHCDPDIDCIYCYPEPSPFIADPKGSKQHGTTQEVRHRNRTEDSPE